MLKGLLSALTAIAAVLSICVFPCSAARDLTPALSAESAVLISARDGTVLAEKNAHQKMGMASTTKILTALVALEHLSLGQVVKIPAEAVGIEGSSIYLVEGEELTVNELLYALLLASANDAAVALAIAACGSVEAFVDKMNLYVFRMGLTSTRLANPHGLDDDQHYTTAYELSLIAARALKSDTLRGIVSTYKTTVRYCGKPNGRVLVNHNKLLKLYSGALGLKTGFTKATGRCLVSAAEREGLTLIAVTLNAPDDWNDHCSLLNYGFDNYRLARFADARAFFCRMAVVGGSRSSVELTNTEPLSFVVPTDSAPLSYRIESTSHFEYAPVSENNFVATITVRCGEQIAVSELVATESVDKLK